MPAAQVCKNVTAVPTPAALCADELPDHPGTRVLALGGSPLVVDGTLLLGLLRGYPAVGANWCAKGSASLLVA